MEYHYKHNFLLGYGEVDEFNRARISSLLNYMQDVATMHSKQIGYGATECNELKIGWVVLSWHIRVLSYPKSDTEIEVRTWARKLVGCHAFRAFDIYDLNCNKILEADSMWALINLEKGRPMKPFDDMIEGYGSIDRNFFEDEKVKIDLPEKIDSTTNFKVLRRDIDTNKHCNNTKYIDFALETVSDNIYENKEIEEIEMIYKKSIVCGDKIEVTNTIVNDNELINVIKNGNGEIATLIKTKWKKQDE